MSLTCRFCGALANTNTSFFSAIYMGNLKIVHDGIILSVKVCNPEDLFSCKFEQPYDHHFWWPVSFC